MVVSGERDMGETDRDRKETETERQTETDRDRTTRPGRPCAERGVGAFALYFCCM
jgi:hypothetical protein